jgi:hypothetical protein
VQQDSLAEHLSAPSLVVIVVVTLGTALYLWLSGPQSIPTPTMTAPAVVTSQETLGDPQ